MFRDGFARCDRNKLLKGTVYVCATGLSVEDPQSLVKSPERYTGIVCLLSVTLPRLNSLRMEKLIAPRAIPDAQPPRVRIPRRGVS